MFPFMKLADIDPWIPFMAATGVSEVARGPNGFLPAYRRAHGSPKELSDAWKRKREGFIKRHMAQVTKRDEPLYDDDGMPTRRHLALIAWAYDPS